MTTESRVGARERSHMDVLEDGGGHEPKNEGGL